MGLEKAGGILIQGAGLVGAALARRCKELGIPFTLLDTGTQKPQTGAGIAVPANGSAAAERLRLGEALRSVGHQVQNIRYVEPNGKELSSGGLGAFSAPFYGMRRDGLLAALRKGIESDIEVGSVRSLQPVSDGVKVVFDDSRSPQKFALVVGADGVGSGLTGIRSLAFPRQPSIDFGVTTFRWLAECDTTGLDPTYMFGPGEALMVYPIGPKEVYCYAHVGDLTRGCLIGDPRVPLSKRFATYKGPLTDFIQNLPAADRVHVGRLTSVPPAMRQGRVVLIGDAAHAMSPMLQQGAAQGWEDVEALTDALAACDLNGSRLDQSLQAWEGFRLPRVTEMQQRSDVPMKKVIEAFQPGQLSGMAFINLCETIRKNGPLNVQAWQKMEHEDYPNQLQAYQDALREPEASSRSRVTM